MYRYIRHLLMLLPIVFSCIFFTGKINKDVFSHAAYKNASKPSIASSQSHFDFYVGSIEECSFELSYDQHLAYAVRLCALGLILPIFLLFTDKKSWHSFYELQNKYLSNRLPDKCILYHTFKIFG
jgi:hypothetical protein